MPEQSQRERPSGSPWDKKEASPFDGPRIPNIEKPDTSKILKKMKTIESDQSKRYKQRNGQ